MFFGLMFGGLGVVPLAIVGALLERSWPIVWNLALALFLTFIPRIVATFVAYRIARREEAKEARRLAMEQPSFDFRGD